MMSAADFNEILADLSANERQVYACLDRHGFPHAIAALLDLALPDAEVPGPPRKKRRRRKLSTTRHEMARSGAHALLAMALARTAALRGDFYAACTLSVQVGLNVVALRVASDRLAGTQLGPRSHLEPRANPATQKARTLVVKAALAHFKANPTLKVIEIADLIKLSNSAALSRYSVGYIRKWVGDAIRPLRRTVTD